MYWDSKYPRLISKQQLKQHMDSGLSKFIGVADITCDLQGSVEFLDYITSIQNPFFVYDPDTDSSYSDLASPGVLMMGVDNLPSELPVDASAHFGQQLVPFLKVLSESDGSLPFDQQNDLPASLKHAVVTAGGSLTPNFAYIQALRNSRAALRLPARTASPAAGSFASAATCSTPVSSTASSTCARRGRTSARGFCRWSQAGTGKKATA